MTQAELNNQAEHMCNKVEGKRAKQLVLVTYTWYVNSYLLDRYKLSLPYCLEPYRD
jgi:hypothetical protein